MCESDQYCPLNRPAQTRNLLLFAACTGLIYLTGPISYVGVTQAALCRELGATDATANLPKTVYSATTVAPELRMPSRWPARPPTYTAPPVAP